MGRTTVYNNITNEELVSQINKKNTVLMDMFIKYLKSMDKSQSTIKQYINDLKIYFVWNLLNNDNAYFTDITKMDVMLYQNYLVNELCVSPSRVRRLKSALSSMSNFIEIVLDKDYPEFRNIINKIPAPAKNAVREKTILKEEDVQMLLDELVKREEYQKACCFALALSSGARKAELTRFKVSYFKDSYIQYGSLYKTPEKIVTKGRGSKGKLLHKYTLVASFKPYLKLWLKERKKLGITCDELFVARVGKEYRPATTTTLDSWTKTYSDILGVDFYLHCLRHLFVTNLCSNNVPSEIIKDIVGWSDTSLISVYNDASVDDEIGKYFGDGGVKKTERKGLSDL
jgi:site-specific recombinase XerD